MGTITVRVSDLSGEQIPDETQLTRLIVEHPDFDEPIGLDVLPEDVEEHLTDERTRFVVVSLISSEGTVPTRYVMLLDEFEQMFRQGDSATVLQTAYAQQQQEKQRTRGRSGRSGRRGRRQERGRRERIDWSSPERAGLDHPGRISDTEKEYVRANLDEVNARRRQHDQRELDPDNPEDVERYGLLPQPRNDDTEQGE